MSTLRKITKIAKLKGGRGVHLFTGLFFCWKFYLILLVFFCFYLYETHGIVCNFCDNHFYIIIFNKKIVGALKGSEKMINMIIRTKL